MNSRWILNHLAASFRHHSLVMISVISVLVFSWTLGISVNLARKNVNTLLTLWGTSQEMNFFLSESLSADQKKSLKQKIERDPRLTDVKVFSGADLVKELSVAGQTANPQSYSKLLEDGELLSLLPDGIQARLDPSISEASRSKVLKDLANAWGNFPGVAQATFGYDFSEQFKSLFNAANVLMQGLVIFLILVSLVIAYQMTHLSISSRKAEVELLELIGASKKFIWTPFLLESALVCLIAYLLSLVTVSFGFRWMKSAFAENPWTSSVAENMISQTLNETLLFGFFAITLSVLGAYLSLRRIHNQSAYARAEARS